MKILIVEDHALFLSGIRLLLENRQDVPEIHEALSLSSAMALLEQHTFDLILLDLKLNDTIGLDALYQVRQAVPQVPIIVLSGEQDPHVMHKAIDEGAMGFITKSSSYEELLDAINLTLAGGVFLPKDMTENRGLYLSGSGKRSDTAVLSSLSVRQREVLRYLVQGAPNKAISSHMNISQNTVKAHLSAIFRTLGASNRTEAVYFAARAGVPLD